MIFNPFEDRKSRDVRNSLGHAFIRAIEENSEKPFLNAESEIAEKFAKNIFPQYLKDYISARKKLLRFVMDELSSVDPGHDFFSEVGIILWNKKLFFEFHEWVEELWVKKKGAERKVFQSLILAAVFYEHLYYGRDVQAEKVAAKAVKILEKFRNDYPAWIDTDLFLEKFKMLDSDPPILNMG